MTRLHEELLREFQEWSGTATTPKALMERISQRLHEKINCDRLLSFPTTLCCDSGRNC